jgi:SAM-dependent methyltransferase
VHWKVKAVIQNAISLLPEGMSYATYYWLQRRFGGLKRTDPVDRLLAGIQTWGHIAGQGIDPKGKVFFEVGTGTTPLVPLAFWLMGASRTITVDVNPYLKEELVGETLDYLAANRASVETLFGTLLQRHRMDDLLQCARPRAFSLKRFLDLCCIDYVGRGDATRTNLPSGSIDFHTSFTVFEHIPSDVLAKILVEGSRIVRDDGLFVHRIDYTDHFWHSDSRISPINFLQYSEEEWARYAGNRYMYMNRLRHDDVLALYEAAGHRILSAAPIVDARSLEALRTGGVRVDRRFEAKSAETLSTSGAWVVSQSATAAAAHGSPARDNGGLDRSVGSARPGAVR